ncbi:MAG TPA: DUF4340 domain-containing protein [Candidatus Krumholzibacteria bacterium]|nr:DUF4340 domain-containing protein [Candidatus Krumholzibacteria bacterium]
MGEMRKTVWMAAAALVLAVLAVVTVPRQKMPEAFFDAGEAFFPDFTDPNAARTLEVVNWDGESGSAVPFKVTFQGGRWTIPSHYDYPADGKDRLAKTAASLIGVTRDDFRTDNVADYEACGVIDPLDTTNPTLSGRGQRITIKGENDVVLADLIIGKMFEGREGFRLVRVPGEKRVYGARINVDVSTAFKDWIESDLMMIDKDEIARLVLKDYSIDETSGRLDVRDEVQLVKDGSDWTMSKLPAGKEMDTYKVNGLVKTIDELSIEDVRPKPEGLTATLSRAAGNISITQADMLSLQDHGFYFSRDGRLVSNEGEVLARTNDGVTYTLRFGEVAVGTGASETAAAGAAPPGENRYLMISASFDPAVFPEPPAPADRSFESQPDSTLTPPQRRQKELAAAHDRWKSRVDAGQKRADELNARFAKWYYVISGTSFEQLHVRRADLVRDKTAKG